MRFTNNVNFFGKNFVKIFSIDYYKKTIFWINNVANIYIYLIKSKKSNKIQGAHNMC